MDSDENQLDQASFMEANLEQHAGESLAEVATLKKNFQNRLLFANLKIEAVKAGMIDLDGLKLIDTTGVSLDNDDNVVGGQTLMADLRRKKPWLFGTTSSSSAINAPASQPVRQKMALEMTDSEYTAARNAIIKYHS